MKTTQEKLNNDLISATKEKDSDKLEVLRFLLSAIKNKQIEQNKELSDEEIDLVIKTNVKQIKDSIKSFKEGGRDDLCKAEEVKLKILTEYLPEQMSTEEIQLIISQVISEVGANSMADFGKVMGAVMSKVKGKADGNEINKLVKQSLS